MIEFVCGGSGSGKTEYVMERIAEAARGEKRIYLIVPDQQAVAAERAAAQRFEPSVFLNLEIVSFSRLANLAARRYGGLNYSECGENGRMLLMWSAVLSVWDSLKIYGGAPGNEDRFVPELMSAVKELQMYAVSPEDMERAADLLSESDGADARLAERLRELALIYSAYMSTALLRGERADVLDRLEAQLRGNRFFAGACVFVDSFFTLTVQEMNILRYAFRDAEEVCMTFCVSHRGGVHFSHIAEFMKRAERLATRYDEVKYTEMTVNRRAASPMLCHLEENLWSGEGGVYGAVYRGEYNGSVKTVTCSDRYHAAQCAAAEIQRLVMSGARYGDIAVVAADIEIHRGILDTALDECGIPYFLSKRREISASPAAKLLYSALSFVGGGWRREELMECVRTGLCPVTDDEADMLDLYTAAWNINGRTAYCGGDWTLNPDGYSRDVTALGKYTLNMANSARRALTEAFERLCDSVSGGGSVESFCRAAVNFLCDFSVYESLENRAADMEKEGRAADAAAERGVWEAIMNALDVMVQTVGDVSVDTGRFVRLLRRVIDGSDVGTIPDGIDRVILGSADSVRADGVLHLIIAEAAQGIFPAASAENGFFSDADKQRLETAGISLSPDREGLQREKLFMFYRICAMPRESLTVLLPRSDGVTALEPGAGVTALREMFPDLENIVMDTPRSLLWNKSTAADTLAAYPDPAAAEALESAGIKLRESEEVPLDASGDRLPPETAAALGGAVLRITQSRLDSFYSCPFAYLCRYTLKLHEDTAAKLSAVDVGNFMHRILELFFTELGERSAASLSDGEIVAIADKLIAEYKGEIFGVAGIPGRIEYMFARLRRSAVLFFRTLAAEFAQSRFKPKFFELVIGAPDAPPPVRIKLLDGAEMEIRGTVDRVDLWQNGERTYVRVVDYKTGTKKFSFDDFATGCNMQLPIYLYTLVSSPNCEFRREAAPDGGELVPAGALYFSARPGDGLSEYAVDGDEAARMAAKNIERSGFLLADESVLRAMDEKGDGEFIPVTFSDKGIKGAAARSADEINDAFRQMTDVLSELGGQIHSGRCDASPVKHGGRSPCEYCGMKNICRVREGAEHGE